MTDPAPRPLATRKHDALNRLQEDVDVWVSTAATDGTPYLMPLSFLWDGETILLSTAATNPTSLNLQATGQLHLALGHTRDVVLITGTTRTLKPEDLSQETGDAFAEKTGFDPRTLKSPYLYFRVTPARIQTWREVNELPARTIMENGDWLV